MQQSNCYWNVKNIDHSITSLNTGLFNGKIRSRLQTSPFLFVLKYNPIYFDPPSAYLLLPKVPTLSPLIRTPVYLGPKSTSTFNIHLALYVTRKIACN